MTARILPPIRTKDSGARNCSLYFSGYVSTVQVGDTLCTGEEVRQMLHLPSASFTVENQVEKVRFLCRGQGHGMGMSQYGAGRMAKEGSTYRDILSYYFPEAEILVMESE